MQASPAPAPSSANTSGFTLVPFQNLTANASAPDLGTGFLPAIHDLVPKVGNITAKLGNASQCGAPRVEFNLRLAKSMLFDLLANAPGDLNMTFEGNLTHLRQWRSFLDDKILLLSEYSSIKKLAKEYFNLSMPTKIETVIEYFSKLNDAKPNRRLMQLSTTPTSFEVPVYVVVVTDPYSLFENGDSVTASSVEEQLAYLNKAFRTTGFSFKVEDIRLVQDSFFFYSEDSSSLEYTWKQSLHKGGPEALNIYIRTPTSKDLDAGKTLLGIARFPEMMCADGKINSLRKLDDSVTILWQTLPDQGYGFLGATLVHEVGHWLSLGHTFNQPSSCKARTGDAVSDTAVEFGPYNQQENFVGGCFPSDSCPNSPGSDPLTNWMDYSPDECYTSFTSEQITVMQANYYYIRVKQQCSYPGQVSPFLNLMKDNQENGSTSLSTSSTLHNLLLAMVTIVALYLNFL